MRSFVEFESAADLKVAVEKLDGREFKGSRVTCVADVYKPRSCLGKALLMYPDPNSGGASLP